MFECVIHGYPLHGVVLEQSADQVLGLLGDRPPTPAVELVAALQGLLEDFVHIAAAEGHLAGKSAL